MAEKTIVLHTAQLNNNCPNCFGTNGLEFTFRQMEKGNALFLWPKSVIEETLYCHNCEHTIYPVNWTEAIERVYDYNKKIAETKRQSLKLKPLFLFLVFAAIIVVAATIYILIS